MTGRRKFRRERAARKWVRVRALGVGSQWKVGIKGGARRGSGSRLEPAGSERDSERWNLSRCSGAARIGKEDRAARLGRGLVETEGRRDCRAGPGPTTHADLRACGSGMFAPTVSRAQGSRSRRPLGLSGPAGSSRPDRAQSLKTARRHPGLLVALVGEACGAPGRDGAAHGASTSLAQLSGCHHASLPAAAHWHAVVYCKVRRTAPRLRPQPANEIEIERNKFV